jgi:hypothetical protein
LNNQAPEESFLRVSFLEPLQPHFTPDEPMQVFPEFFELPNVDKRTFLRAMSDCVAFKKCCWQIEGVNNTAYDSRSSEGGEGEEGKGEGQDQGQKMLPVKKKQRVKEETGGWRMQAFVLGVTPPEQWDNKTKTGYLRDCINAAWNCVCNPVPEPKNIRSFKSKGEKPPPSLYEKGQLVSFVLTHCISVVTALMGNRYVVTGASLMFFKGGEVTAQPWHLDYTPQGHAEDDGLHFTWEPKVGTKGKMMNAAGDCEQQDPLLFIFSFSDNYFLEHIPGPMIDHNFKGLGPAVLDSIECNTKTTPLPFGSLAVFAPWCIHRGPAKDTSKDPTDQEVFRFHLFASPKTNIRGHHNTIFKVLKQPNE